LKPLGYYLSVETNGTIVIPTGIIDWICVSPKDQEYKNLKIKQRIGDELKVVYLGQDLSMYDELKDGFENLFLQPLYDEGQNTEWNGMSFHSTFEKVRNNPEWRLSLQTHKWMGVE
jgi:organic radical activating enzyme